MRTHVLSDAEYSIVTDALVRMAGLVFDVSRRSAISAILHERMDKTRHSNVGTYLGYVESTLGTAERQQLLDAVTIQETHFFRNLPQIEALRRDVLPDLLRRNRSTGRPLTIWSAGCSTGEEPYTLAMLLVQLFEETGPFCGADHRYRCLCCRTGRGARWCLLGTHHSAGRAGCCGALVRRAARRQLLGREAGTGPCRVSAAEPRDRRAAV